MLPSSDALVVVTRKKRDSSGNPCMSRLKVVGCGDQRVGHAGNLFGLW